MEKYMNTKINNPIIQLKGVNIHQLDVQVFKNLDLIINQGEFLYLIGNTGSGKSSLLKSFYADLQVSSGEIHVTNMCITNIKENDIPKLRRNLGIVFQDLQLLSDRNIFENLAFVLKSTGWKDKEKIKKRIKEVLEYVQLDNIENKMPHTLSGGEQQRAVIARALLNKPSIIIADEPTGNLDPDKSEKIIRLLKEINTTGTTIIIATHDYSIIQKYKARTLKCENQKVNEFVIGNE
tara:strand:+ start:644 stop:1351 length:708 start_codon:yes stop_codon:yes gene_type:complete